MSAKNKFEVSQEKKEATEQNLDDNNRKMVHQILNSKNPHQEVALNILFTDSHPDLKKVTLCSLQYKQII